MYEIFFKESKFCITDSVLSEEFVTKAYKYVSDEELKGFVMMCLADESEWHVCIYGLEEERLFRSFCQVFKVVEAAGGVVCESNRFLAINRLGYLDLPKGHREQGESVEECAVREVEEECGIRELKIERPLRDTWHVYYRDSRWYLKRTYWFVMTAPTGQKLVPQTEEDIESAQWMNVSDIPMLLSQTYASLRAVMLEITNL